MVIIVIPTGQHLHLTIIVVLLGLNGIPVRVRTVAVLGPVPGVMILEYVGSFHFLGMKPLNPLTNGGITQVIHALK